VERLVPRLLPWVFGAIALWASLLLPVGEGPDEFSHVQYAQWIARHGSLPPLVPQVAIVQRHQMPLWYVMLAPAIRGLGLERAHLWPRQAWPDDPKTVPGQFLHHGADEVRPSSRDVRAFHALRWLTIPFGMALVWLTWRLAALLFPRREGNPVVASVPVLAAALVATLPTFTHFAGVVSNDPPAAALSAAGLWLVARLVVAKPPHLLRDAAFAGALLGLGVSTKLSAAPLGALAFAVVVLAAIVRRDAALGRAALVLGVAFALLASPYFVWNAVVRGDPVANLSFESRHFREKTEFFAGVPGLQYYLHVWAPSMFRTFFGGFGWTIVSLHPAALAGYGLLLAAGVLGLPLALRRGDRRMRVAALAVMAACVLEIVPQAMYARRYGQPQGRHLYPLLPAIGLLLALGWSGWIGLTSRPRVQSIVGAAILVALVGLEAYAFVGPFRSAFTDRGRASDPWFAITDLDRVLADGPDRIVLEDAPADGAVLGPDGPAPTIRWRGVEGIRYAVHVATDDPSFATPPYDLRSPVYRTYEVDGLVLEDRWTIPPRMLRLFPRDRPIHWRVVELVPVRRIVDGVTTRAVSETRHFVIREGPPGDDGLR